MRLNIERQKDLEPKRMEYARKAIEDLGYEIFFQDEKVLSFIFNGSVVEMWPYSGWHSGKTITNGRGIEKLIKQIKP